MNWYNAKDVKNMLSMKRYQQKQVKRLSRPKRSNALFERCNSHMTRSLTHLMHKRLENREKITKSNENTNRSHSKLEQKLSQYIPKRENKLSRSQYGTLNQNSISQDRLNNTYGDKEVLQTYKTLEHENREQTKNSYLATLDQGKRSRVTSLLQNRGYKGNNFTGNLARHHSQKGNGFGNIFLGSIDMQNVDLRRSMPEAPTQTIKNITDLPDNIMPIEIVQKGEKDKLKNLSKLRQSLKNPIEGKKAELNSQNIEKWKKYLKQRQNKLKKDAEKHK